MMAYSNLHEAILASTRFYFFKRFSLRFLLFSSLSFLVIGLSLALLIPNSVTRWNKGRIEHKNLILQAQALRGIFAEI
jgi:hypothetical protein